MIQEGITFDEFVCLAECNGLLVEAFAADTTCALGHFVLFFVFSYPFLLFPTFADASSAQKTFSTLSF